ncbi:RluA family pseudouridine synthase [Fructobacillus ficulneus]|uniref:RNA pseudouridylate synthase n=1 Tax=Fructobacillus ficulneus TaxID=157463 RepID=A0A0K8MG42_9LACO|nr:RluA family pseudouridine synthase [Fructobacillus ficulneus]GAO99501.1 pseudouridine synthase [Fructobacillus ficulneus]
MTFKKIIQINNDQAGLTVKEYLTAVYLPKHFRGYLRINKGITVNNQPCSTATILHAGDLLTLVFAKDAIQAGQGPYPANDQQKIAISYENEDLLVVDKPAGMKMHPHSPTETDTLLNYVQAYLEQGHSQSAGQQASAYMVHRLDRATSGLVIIGKNPIVVPILNRLIKEKEIERFYQACVTGIFQSDSGEYRDKIGVQEGDDRLRWVMTGGQSAQTLYRVLAMNQDRNQSLVELQLKTGRMHQLRVHLAYHQHPIVGDDWYGGEPAERLMLNSTKMKLILPFSREVVWLDSRQSFYKK